MLAYRDSLPEDKKHPGLQPQGPKKPMETFHIPVMTST
jgi:hypothetical protein